MIASKKSEEKTLSNPRNEPKNEKNQRGTKKTHGNHNSESSIQPSLSQDLTMKLSS
jgi:hypothetical protein